MTDERTATLLATFAQQFGRQPEGAVRAPGRVNLIGEHTDYNDGFCLPMAIERDMRVAWAKRDDNTVRICDVGLPEDGIQEFTLSTDIAKDPACRWLDYPKGCAQVLMAEGVPLVGCELCISANVPLGSGLSSSAAFEVATILALLAAAGERMDATRIAQLAQRAENAYVGTNCGILDQLSSARCQAGQASLMDCRALSLEPVPLPAGVKFVIADTGKRRGLVDSAYNERRAQCEAGAAALGVSHLRDVTLHGLAEAVAGGKLEPIAQQRCDFIVGENGRTQAAAAVLRAGDAVAFGQLMDQSHHGLRFGFEVTCAELDTMVTIARALPGCLGSRMTGAGFGGCTVSLVEDDRVDAFVEVLLERYRSAFPEHTGAAYKTGAAAGAGPLAI